MENVILKGVLKNHYSWDEIDALGINVYQGTISAALGIVGTITGIVTERKNDINYKGVTLAWAGKISYDENRNPFYPKTKIDSIVTYLVQKGHTFNIKTKTWNRV